MTPAEQELLIEIKAVVAALPVEFSLGTDAIGMCLYAPAADGDGHEVLIRMEPALSYQQQEAIVRSPRYYRFLLEMLGRGARAYRDLQHRLEQYEPPTLPDRSQRKQPDHAQRAAMLCDRQSFRRYLREVFDLPDTADRERTAVKLRFLLKIDSRAELNTNPEATARWLKFEKDYYTWMKQPQL